MREYKTKWFYADMCNPDKTTFDMVQAFLANDAYMKNKELLAQYVIYTALSGQRRTEAFLKN